MTPWLLTWVLSLMGAALFFAAGGVWMRKRATGVDAPPPVVAFAAEPAASQPERLSQRVRQSESQRPPGQDAAPPRSAGSAQLVAEAEQRAATTERLLRAELAQSSRRSSQLENELARARSEQVALHERLTAERARVEAELQSATRECESLAARVAGLAAQEAGDARLLALRQELALTAENLRSRDAQLEQLRHDNARLRTFEREYARLDQERTLLREDLRRARANAFTGSRSQPPSVGGVAPSVRPPAGTSSAEGLQSVVDAETKSGRAKSAVIADELGLVVVASEASAEHGDALAAFGAYLVEVGDKTRQVLPLHELREVLLRDDHGVVLSVVPLQQQEAGLSLVTLGMHAKR